MNKPNKTVSMPSAPIGPGNLDELIEDLEPRPFNTLGKVWMAGLAIITVISIFFYIQQLRQGLSITSMSDYTIWGIYVSNCVFFVALSLVGSLVSAILKLVEADWRTPLTRIAEIIAVGSIIMAGIVIIIDMGRPDRMLNLFLYPRLQSPIIWDVIVISTYLVLSLLFLYLPLIPDFAILRDRSKSKPARLQKIYKFLAINWKNTAKQKKALRRAIHLLAVVIVPVAFGIHTVTSWLFATTFRPGWDSASIGPYFVAGAFMVGAAGVICAMFILRRFYGFKNYFRDKHFDKISRLLLMLSLIYLYFNVNEYFIPAYKMKAYESEHLHELFTGHLTVLFWTVQIVGILLPIIILLFKQGRKPLVAFIVSVVVIIMAWYKRFLIVVPSLYHPLIPAEQIPTANLHYTPSFQEWTITIGTLTCALLIITLLVRYLPVIPIAETAIDKGYDVDKLFKESQDKNS